MSKTIESAKVDELRDSDLDLVSGGDLTVGGTAIGRGRVITNGGNNTNLAAGKFSSADQQ
jgi:hypothetical protein